MAASVVERDFLQPGIRELGIGGKIRSESGRFGHEHTFMEFASGYRADSKLGCPTQKKAARKTCGEFSSIQAAPPIALFDGWETRTLTSFQQQPLTFALGRFRTTHPSNPAKGGATSFEKMYASAKIDNRDACFFKHNQFDHNCINSYET